MHLTDSLEDLVKVAMTTSVWVPATITDEPETYLTQWQVFRVKANLQNLGDTIHFVGYAQYEGRVCSPVIEYDKKTHRGLTKSGRIYELVGPSGHNNDAMYVWNRWVDMVGSPEFIVVTDQYE